jgi:hypothetical protein
MVTRTGESSTTASVGYATSASAGLNDCSVLNGIASARCDYGTSVGTLSFAAGETVKTISVPIVDDAYAEGSESFSISLNSPSGANLGPATMATIRINDNESANGLNPIDQAEFFVRQHYVEFLSREPDAAGLAFWRDQITSCGADPQCIDIRRINASAAFFLSIEFQETGYLVYRMHKAAYGNLPGAPVPVMQYFGYLRRNPNDVPDANFNGYDFWLNKLNQFNGNFVNAEMVTAFLVSAEYRQRYGP